MYIDILPTWTDDNHNHMELTKTVFALWNTKMDTPSPQKETSRSHVAMLYLFTDWLYVSYIGLCQSIEVHNLPSYTHYILEEKIKRELIEYVHSFK
jgi:hypothetical protein